MNKIILWKGYHSRDAYLIFKQCWDQKTLLIFCPPYLNSFGFINLLPSGDIQLLGDWGDEDKKKILSKKRAVSSAYSDRPILGIFTSGTSQNNPQLVLYSKLNITTCLETVLTYYDIARIKAVFSYPQPFHVFGLILGYVMCHLYHFELISAEGRYSTHHHEVWTNLFKKEILTLGTPTHFKDLIYYVNTKRINLAPSYSAIVGGAKVEVVLWKSIKEILKVEFPSIGYGCTENTLYVAHLPPGHAPREDGEIGIILPHVTINPVDSIGFEVSSKSVCSAFVQDNTLTFPTKILIKDQIRWREDGVGVFLSRTDSILNRGGQKFILDEIESLLLKKLDINVVCVALPHTRLGQELGILVEAKQENYTFLKKTIYNLLESELHRKFDTSNFALVDKIPMNASLKIDRNASIKTIQLLKNYQSII